MNKNATNSKTFPRASFQNRYNCKMSFPIQTFTTTSTQKFTGKEIDAETGLYYYGARYLDPKMSRWLSVDPAMYQEDYIPSAPINEEARKRNGNLPGQGGIYNLVNMHVYHYAGNNPVKYVYPDGEAINFAIGLVVGFVSAAAVEVGGRMATGQNFSDAGTIMGIVLFYVIILL